MRSTDDAKLYAVLTYGRRTHDKIINNNLKTIKRELKKFNKNTEYVKSDVNYGGLNAAMDKYSKRTLGRVDSSLKEIASIYRNSMKKQISTGGKIDTRRLYKSVRYRKDVSGKYTGRSKDVTYVAGIFGDNVPRNAEGDRYDIYVNYGTGKYVPGGRTTPWAYSTGPGEDNVYFTEGQKGIHFYEKGIMNARTKAKMRLKRKLGGK